MIWKCLECKKRFSVELIEAEKKCPNCGCCDFGVYLSDNEKIELKVKK